MGKKKKSDWADAVWHLMQEIPTLNPHKPVYFTSLLGFIADETCLEVQLYPFSVWCHFNASESLDMTGLYTLLDLITYVTEEKLWICWQD